MVLLRIIQRMLRMKPDAWYIFIRSVQLTAFMLFCAFILLLHCQGSLMSGYREYMTAITLIESGQAVLLVAVILSVCIEDIQS